MAVRQLDAESKLLSERAIRAKQDEQEAKYLQEELSKDISSLETQERETKRQKTELMRRKEVLIDNKTQADLDYKETKERFEKKKRAVHEAQVHLKRLEADIGSSKSALDEVCHWYEDIVGSMNYLDLKSSGSHSRSVSALCFICPCIFDHVWNGSGGESSKRQEAAPRGSPEVSW